VARGNVKGLHPWVVDFETKCIRSDACARALLKLKAEGYRPDLVVGHPAWGETWLVKDVWPDTRLLAFQEFYYGSDGGFDPEFARADFDAQARTRVKNASVLLGLETMDWGMSPMAWQRHQFPTAYRDRISVVFDGIDTDALGPNRETVLKLGNAGPTLRWGDEIVTFVNRNLEPYRGYHVFMRALPKLLAARPKAQVVIVGGNDSGYGAAPPAGQTWREIFLREVSAHIDLTRVHFLGRVPPATLLALFRVTACHVYLTYPFVLSWSMIEAMSAGALVVGSRTPPVQEVVTDGENGLLVDFFDHHALAERVAEVLGDSSRFEALRVAARATAVSRYDLTRLCLPAQLALAQHVAEGRSGPPGCVT
jgi:glycosyltransferase involved in cell wall biosynthesis